MKEVNVLSENKKKTSIGGSAIIEGVMMRGPSKMAIAVRKPDSEIIVDISDVKLKSSVFRKTPIIRGVVNFFDSMVTSVKALMYSAEFFDIEEEEEKPSKFEAWLEKKLGDNLKTVVIYTSVIISLCLSIGLFFLLPSLITNFLYRFFEYNQVVRSLIEGAIRISIFLVYLLICSKQKDVNRVFQYHGAEHKTIFCYESGEELTVENCRKQSRLHPRCGTSFLVFVMLISIIVFSFVGITQPFLRAAIKLLCLPLIAGLSYEVIKLAGRSDNKLVCVISKPGMWLQYITTKEPDDAMLEVAIAAMKPVIPDDENEAKW